MRLSLNRPFASAFLWAAQVFLRMGRLEKIELLQLRATLEAATNLYQRPLSETPDEHHSDATHYKFQVSPWHAVKALVWRGEVHAVSYYLAQPSPERDLRVALAFYGEGKKWKALEAGYHYERDDGDRLIHVSAVPILSVETRALVEARWQMQTDSSRDPTGQS